MAEKKPALIAFDLDGTLWYPEMYLLDGAPYEKSTERNSVMTRGHDQVELIRDSQAILSELATDEAWSNTHVAYVSRTTHPKWAKTCLQLLDVTPDTNMDAMSPLQEIYPGNKKKHFKKIHAQTSIPYRDMLFFDNERWNCQDVSQLGVTCVYTPQGMTREKWLQGLREFAQVAVC
eukprot:jgi/Ulvmu1/11268/UM073_0040.1